MAKNRNTETTHMQGERPNLRGGEDDGNDVEETALVVSDGNSDGLTPEARAMLEAFKQEKGAAQVNLDVYYHRFGDEIAELDAGGKPTGKKRMLTYPIQGIVVKRETRTVKATDTEPARIAGYYILYLTKPTTLWRTPEGKDDGIEAIEGKPGMYAWVDERYSVQSLAAYVPKEQTVNGITTVVQMYECLIIPKRKKRLGNGRSTWICELLVLPRQPGPNYPTIAPKGNAPQPKQLEQEATAEGDIPF